MVRTGGLEPPRGYPRQILSLLRLPIPPRPHLSLSIVDYSTKGQRICKYAPLYCYKIVL